MVIPQTRTAKLYRVSCAKLSASQGLLAPLCRASTSNAVKAELLKSSKTQLTPVTIFSVYCHLASASGAWWQKLRDWGGASSLRPSGSLTQTLFHKHLQDLKKKKKNTFIFSSSILLLCVHTQYNPFAHPSHPSCLYYYLLSPIDCFCTSYLFLHILPVLHILFCTFLYSITHFTLYFSFLPIYMLLCGVTFI